MGLLSYLVNPESPIRLQDLPEWSREEKKRKNKKRKSRVENLTEELAGLYNPTSFLLKNAPGILGIRGKIFRTILNLINDFQDSWKKS